MLKEFKDYLLKQNVIALALAVVIGAALNKVVQSLVNDIIMPFVSAVTPSDQTWETLKVSIGPLHFGVGDLLSTLLNFVIIAFVVWRISKLGDAAARRGHEELPVLQEGDRPGRHALPALHEPTGVGRQRRTVGWRLSRASPPWRGLPPVV